MDTSTVVGLNPTWHSAAGVVWGNVTVTMAEMWESFVKVESGVKTPVTGLIVTMHQHLWHTTPCRSCVLSDCGHTSSQWSTLHWIHCEPHLPHTPTTTWGGGDLPVERLCPLHISSCCKHQPNPMPLSPLGEATLTQQDTTVRFITEINCLPQGNTVITVQGRLHLPTSWCDSILCMYTVCMYCVQVCCLQLDQLMSSITLQTLSSCKSISLQLQHSPGTTYEPSHGTTMESRLSLDHVTITIIVSFHWVVTTQHSTITNAQRSDAGVYHVQFGGLRIYPYNKLCEEETLAILRHYPVLSPVVFNVYTNGKLTNKYPYYP